MRSFNVVLAIILAFGLGQALAQAPHYTMDDLEALKQHRAWREIVAHLDDVAPAQRTERWQTIAEAAVTGVVAEDGAASDVFAAALAAEAALSRFPFLRQSRSFMDKRAEVGLRGFAQCFERSDATDCGQRLRHFVADDPANADLAFGAGRLIAREVNANAAPWYFEQAVARAPGGERCGDEVLHRSLIAGLALPADRPEAASARRLAAGPCWEASRQDVVDEFTRNDRGSYYHQNTCAFLIEKQALSGLRAAKCKGVAAP